MALTSFPTRWLSAEARIRNGFIPCASMPKSFGAPDAAWERAMNRTPHGKAIELSAEDFRK
jgi:hypothetical protein